jgi:chorismate mutase
MSDNGLEPFRRRLDEIDDQVAKLLGERLQICREVAIYKSEHEIPMMQPHRVKAVRERYLARGAEVNLPEEFTSDLFELLIATTCKLEDELMDELAAKNGGGEAA